MKRINTRQKSPEEVVRNVETITKIAIREELKASFKIPDKKSKKNDGNFDLEKRLHEIIENALGNEYPDLDLASSEKHGRKTKSDLDSKLAEVFSLHNLNLTRLKFAFSKLQAQGEIESFKPLNNTVTKGFGFELTIPDSKIPIFNAKTISVVLDFDIDPGILVREPRAKPVFKLNPSNCSINNLMDLFCSFTFEKQEPVALEKQRQIKLTKQKTKKISSIINRAFRYEPYILRSSEQFKTELKSFLKLLYIKLKREEINEKDLLLIFKFLLKDMLSVSDLRQIKDLFKRYSIEELTLKAFCSWRTRIAALKTCSELPDLKFKNRINSKVPEIVFRDNNNFFVDKYYILGTNANLRRKGDKALSPLSQSLSGMSSDLISGIKELQNPQWAQDYYKQQFRHILLTNLESQPYFSRANPRLDINSAVKFFDKLFSHMAKYFTNPIQMKIADLLIKFIIQEETNEDLHADFLELAKLVSQEPGLRVLLEPNNCFEQRANFAIALLQGRGLINSYAPQERYSFLDKQGIDTVITLNPQEASQLKFLPIQIKASKASIGNFLNLHSDKIPILVTNRKISYLLDKIFLLTQNPYYHLPELPEPEETLT